MEVTVSSIKRQPYFLHTIPIAFMSPWRQPVEVSAWHNHSRFGLYLRSPFSTSATVNGWPGGFSIFSTFSVYRPCRSSARSPKYPFTQIRCTSPTSVRFATPASQAADPVPETGTVNSFPVCHTYRSRCLMSSTIRRKSPSMCPIWGRLIAACTRGSAFCGPGPSNSRRTGFKRTETAFVANGFSTTLAIVLVARCSTAVKISYILSSRYESTQFYIYDHSD
mmetsp:Transcript_1541/g.3635  ORF Transcript_1541/g.3635 Transcript_1541/m.3635 type:complete len:222 (-) Transcript_1541:68-733(-)